LQEAPTIEINRDVMSKKSLASSFFLATETRTNYS